MNGLCHGKSGVIVYQSDNVFLSFYAFKWHAAAQVTMQELYNLGGPDIELL